MNDLKEAVENLINNLENDGAIAFIESLPAAISFALDSRHPVDSEAQKFDRVLAVVNAFQIIFESGSVPCVEYDTNKVRLFLKKVPGFFN